MKKKLIFAVALLILLVSCSKIDVPHEESDASVIPEEPVSTAEEVVEEDLNDYSVFDGGHHDIVEDTTLEESEFTRYTWGRFPGNPTVSVMAKTSKLTIDGIRFTMYYGTLIEAMSLVESDSHVALMIARYGFDPNLEGYYVMKSEYDELSMETLVFPDQYDGTDIVGILGTDTLILPGMKNIALPENLVLLHTDGYCRDVDDDNYHYSYSAHDGFSKDLEVLRIGKKLSTVPLPRQFGHTKIKYFPFRQLSMVQVLMFSDTDVERVTLSESVSFLGHYSFSFCDELSYCDLSKTNIEKLYDGVFESCKKLKTVILPNTLKYVFEPFLYATSVNDIVYKGTKEEFYDIQFGYGTFHDIDPEAKITCDDGVISIQDVLSHAHFITSNEYNFLNDRDFEDVWR